MSDSLREGDYLLWTSQSVIHVCRIMEDGTGRRRVISPTLTKTPIVNNGTVVEELPNAKQIVGADAEHRTHVVIGERIVVFGGAERVGERSLGEIGGGIRGRVRDVNNEIGWSSLHPDYQDVAAVAAGAEEVPA